MAEAARDSMYATRFNAGLQTELARATPPPTHMPTLARPTARPTTTAGPSRRPTSRPTSRPTPSAKSKKSGGADDAALTIALVVVFVLIFVCCCGGIALGVPCPPWKLLREASDKVAAAPPDGAAEEAPPPAEDAPAPAPAPARPSWVARISIWLNRSPKDEGADVVVVAPSPAKARDRAPSPDAASPAFSETREDTPNRAARESPAAPLRSPTPTKSPGPTRNRGGPAPPALTPGPKATEYQL